MSDRLSRLLDQRPYLLADGATGTNYFALGLMTGDAPELWNLEHPERVKQVHADFIAAGSDIVLTNTFGGTRHRLKLHHAQDRVVEINAAAARLAREVTDATEDREIVVAGSMGPTGEILEPLGPLSLEAATEAFAEQARGLAEGGADVLWIETISSKDELDAALKGAETTGLPIVATLSFDTNGRTMMGVTPGELAAHLSHHTAPPLAYGGNCGVGPAELMAALVNMAGAKRADDVLIAKSNCGIPEFVDGEIVYSGTPPLMAAYARLARDAGARIIGGCCGTQPTHIAAMKASLEGYAPKSLPSLEDIVAALGPISTGAEAQSALGPLGKAEDEGSGAGRGRRRGGRRARSEEPRF